MGSNPQRFGNCLPTHILSNRDWNPSFSATRFMATETTRERVVELVREIGVARGRDFRLAGIHQQYVADA